MLNTFSRSLIIWELAIETHGPNKWTGARVRTGGPERGTLPPPWKLYFNPWLRTLLGTEARLALVESTSDQRFSAIERRSRKLLSVWRYCSVNGNSVTHAMFGYFVGIFRWSRSFAKRRTRNCVIHDDDANDVLRFNVRSKAGKASLSTLSQ